MSLFLLKLVLTPLLIAGTTLAARRWGPVVGGWIVSLPLTSGPVSVFLALEQGPEFAATAAAGTILGSLAVIAFCLAYTRAAIRAAWPWAVLAGVCGFALTVAVMNRLSLPPVPGAVFVCAALAAVLALEKRLDAQNVRLPAPVWDIPLRMAVATGIVLLITTLSSHLGPTLSGLCSAFPAFICVMSVFSHKLCGAESVRQFAHGVIIGTFAFVAFFLTVALTLPHMGVLAVYTLAVLSAFAVNGGFMFFHAWKNGRMQRQAARHH